MPVLAGLALPRRPHGRPGHPLPVKTAIRHLIDKGYTVPYCHALFPRVKPSTMWHWISDEGWRKVAKPPAPADIAQQTITRPMGRAFEIDRGWME